MPKGVDLGEDGPLTGVGVPKGINIGDDPLSGVGVPGEIGNHGGITGPGVPGGSGHVGVGGFKPSDFDNGHLTDAPDDNGGHVYTIYDNGPQTVFGTRSNITFVRKHRQFYEGSGDEIGAVLLSSGLDKADEMYDEGDQAMQHAEATTVGWQVPWKLRRLLFWEASQYLDMASLHFLVHFPCRHETLSTPTKATNRSTTLERALTHQLTALNSPSTTPAPGRSIR